MNKQEQYHEKLKRLIDSHIHSVYDEVAGFPRDEKFGAASQLKRASMSVMLNYVEGYARNSSNQELKRFLSTSYGSLKESEYLIKFSGKRGWINRESMNDLLTRSDEIARMLWSVMKGL